MPLVSRIMLRFALIYFVISALIGAFLLADKASSIHPNIWQLLPVHIECILFGWVIQFTLGTAYWMLPRLLIGEPRGNRRLSFLIPICLNIGIFLVIISYLLPLEAEIKYVGRLLEFIAVSIFIALHWKRVSKVVHIH